MKNFSVNHSNLTQCYQQILLIVTFIVSISGFSVKAETSTKIANGIYLKLDDVASSTLTSTQKNSLVKNINIITQKTKKLLTNFPESLSIHISIVDNNLENVDGIIGIAETNSLISIEISKTYSGGIDKIISNGFKNTLYHELHHITRGWTINENKFGPSIAIAAVNEGLATVFAEKYSQYSEAWSQTPDNIDSWVKEVLDLPVNAPYNIWMMGAHPDGRNYIGYKVGKYIVQEAIKQSKHSIVTLSQYSPFEILKFSGLIDHHAASLEKLGDFYAISENEVHAVNTYQLALTVTAKEDEPLKAVLKKKIRLIENPVQLTVKQLHDYVGNYKSENPSFSAIISLNDNNKLNIKLSGKPTFELHPDTPHSFFIYEAPLKVTFIDTTETSPVELRVNFLNQELKFSKTSQ